VEPLVYTPNRSQWLRRRSVPTEEQQVDTRQVLRNFSLLRSVQIDCGDPPNLLFNGYRRLFQQWLRINGAIPPLLECFNGVHRTLPSYIYNPNTQQRKKIPADIKNTVVCDVTPRTLADKYRCFGGTCCFHLIKGHKFVSNRSLINAGTPEDSSLAGSCALLIGKYEPTLRMIVVSPKRRLTTGRQGETSQQTNLQQNRKFGVGYAYLPTELHAR
jgi:hypothetical protein